MTFKLEERYVVFKLSLMTEAEKLFIESFLKLTNIPKIDCVVVEDDWPEYRMVMNSLEGRC